ncbi:PP2C family protein-serine/threonine phosphatase [Geotalea uraniireducens]|uniref:Stage II sporulation E family protein n=1 Tax=Geotalea uraniireducens (strain Rf4) TaxID=351605 RepID=A5G6U0_GEOUR|nr:PP2C family protein-serine/threonine phosphatase [Geotalea uraniireducens]ABQ27508.1 Stage II sporulation E family protein [Geotalea uraniireducens Rf4]
MATNDDMTRGASNMRPVLGNNKGAANGIIDAPELDLAEKVQQLLLPKSSPVCTWCCIGIKNRMAAGLGGDYFDFITMPDECQSLFIGDVTGHGLHASVVMSLIYGYIHRATLGTCAPLELMQQVNTFLVDFARRSQTIDQYFSSSLFYGIINPGTLNMHYVNAGHVPALVLRNGIVHELHSTGPPVGFFEAAEMHLQSFSFTKGDRLLFYTDGIIEATNASGEQFGLDRLKRFLQATSDADYMEFLERLFGTLIDFGISDPPQDDCTAIVIDLHGLLS